MNADFNVGFLLEQSFAEQLFNRASLQEFRGRMITRGIQDALARLESSLKGIDGAIDKTGKLLAMLRANGPVPEFREPLARHLSALGVNGLPRVGPDARRVATLGDVLLVLESEFKTLREMTVETIKATRDLQPQIEKGLFVATVLEAKTPFNQAKITLGFARGIVETFMSTACHATIRASEDIFPLGYDFLLEPKREIAFLRGDCNGDGSFTGSVTDAVFMLTFGFLGGPPPPCLAACDVNADGAFLGQVTDAVYLLTFNFLGGPAPPPPFPQCGPSNSPGDLAQGCETPRGDCQ